MWTRLHFLQFTENQGVVSGAHETSLPPNQSWTSHRSINHLINPPKAIAHEQSINPPTMNPRWKPSISQKDYVVYYAQSATGDSRSVAGPYLPLKGFNGGKPKEAWPLLIPKRWNSRMCMGFLGKSMEILWDTHGNLLGIWGIHEKSGRYLPMIFEICYEMLVGYRRSSHNS